MITHEQLKNYEEQGYIIFEDLFSEEQIAMVRSIVDKLNEEFDKKMEQIGRSGISVENKISFNMHLTAQDPYMNTFVGNEKMVSITTALLGPNVKLYWDQSAYKKQEANRDFPWHQDNGYGPIEPEHYVTCWLALEDATIENGCIWIQPGTHKQGLVEHRDTDVGKQCYFGEDPGIPVPLRKGSMVAFHSLLFHRSTPNCSDTIRKGYIMQYSVDGAVDPRTGKEIDNGPVIARNGKAVLT
ncbi:phytanoyl-CoA dioxygenase family protein [Paenibacillus caseinilyticus]|uniref:Phytanoyl-CoA dioxygenase n=1 Tax=Paenibacillus mucilaginosus K02 TaxID=997761 RepID=I0BFD0_9BACL|nr:phytanoyl-CoA dioxygenase family protein [Paenibacillus mucilaginosus]AFH61077.1 hypothetical protein B2K_10135 [Paenibacillus mucilaginosus K02]